MLKKYKLNHKDIAKLFCYKNDNSFNNSTSKKELLIGIDKLIRYIEDSIREKI